MAADPALADNAGRVRHEHEIDKALTLWCGQHSSSYIIGVLEAARVPVGPIYSVADMLEDPQYQARGMFEQVEIDGKPLKIPAIMPRLGTTPGRTDWPGSSVGSHNQEILQGLLGLQDDDLQALAADGVICPGQW
jgi:crotonobetainyl-CoA:carnitine CoA-transferase CaiB-like acyl-CoA transferase